MTEDEYILVSDLAHIMSAKDCLRWITADNNPHIEKDDYVTVHLILERWQEGIYNALNVVANDEA